MMNYIVRESATLLSTFKSNPLQFKSTRIRVYDFMCNPRPFLCVEYVLNEMHRSNVSAMQINGDMEV